MGVKLTKRLVDAADGDSGKDTYLWDAELRGFGVRIQSAGGVKSFVLKYGMGRRGQARKYTIGQVGAPWTVETARDEARRLLGLVASGVDPAQARAAGAAMPTIAEFAERYLREYAEPHKKALSVREDRGNLRRAILPDLGALRLDRITRADIARFHVARRDTPANANRCLALLSHMFTMAEKWGLRPDNSNPCRHVERFRENKRERFLSEAELARLGTALAEVEAEGSEAPIAIAAIRLLVFTGCRVSEVLKLRWEHVTLDTGLARLPDSKTGAKTVVLNAPARELLAGLPRFDGNPYVIFGIRKGAHLTDLQHPWQRIRGRAGLVDVRLHDLRHSFASVGASSGESLLIIGGLLGHTRATTTQRYAHLSQDPLRSASEAIGARIVTAMKGGAGDQAPPAFVDETGGAKSTVRARRS
jgi:integrase